MENRIHLKIEEIKRISDFRSYDHVIEIESRYGIHLIERNWMKKKEFDIVKMKLQRKLDIS